MNSKISNERLVIAAVKGDCQAKNLLKVRLKPKIGSTIERFARCCNEEIRNLEDQVMEKVFDSLNAYQFIGPFLGWVQQITINRVLLHNRSRNEVIKPSHRKTRKKQLNLSGIFVEDEHPPPASIDPEIRSLVALLNQSSDIQTFSSCSGHPKQGKWNPYGGWISMIPTGNPCRTLEFLVGLLTLLDNTTVMKPGSNGHEDGNPLVDTIRKRYDRIDANGLFRSGVPIVTVDVSFEIFVCHSEMARRLQIWKQLIASIRDLITDTDELDSVIDTPEAAVKCLQQAVQQLPFVYSVRFVPNCAGYPWLQLQTKADLALCQWCLDVANRIDTSLHKAGYSGTEGNADFTAQWAFALQPFLNPELIPLPHLITTPLEPRTREDHLKIWQLIELAVAEQLGLTET